LLDIENLNESEMEKVKSSFKFDNSYGAYIPN
jgi:hypothetical protein